MNSLYKLAELDVNLVECDYFDSQNSLNFTEDGTGVDVDLAHDRFSRSAAPPPHRRQPWTQRGRAAAGSLLEGGVQMESALPHHNKPHL